MDKVDLRAERRDLYAPKPGVFTIVEVPAFRFLATDGRGDPDTVPEYPAAVAALFAASYAAKFLSKGQLGRDYVVLPLEGLWRSEGHDFSDRGGWDWTMLIRQPDWLDAGLLEESLRRAAAKGHSGVDLRVEDYAEGLSVQTLHLGAYDAEAPTIARLHDEFLPAEGLEETGDHHEIYLSDPRRVAPEKLRTILRQPVRRLR
ncbi:GyrI-like domain-containing protein [Microbacteriaceae bacterium 4G12]